MTYLTKLWITFSCIIVGVLCNSNSHGKTVNVFCVNRVSLINSYMEYTHKENTIETGLLTLLLTTMYE